MLKKLCLTVFFFLMATDFLFSDELKQTVVLTYPRQTGDDVKKLQILLVDYGFLTKKDIDGIYGPQSQEAAIYLQLAFGFAPTGEVTNTQYEIFINKNKNWQLEAYIESLKKRFSYKKTFYSDEKKIVYGLSTEGSEIRLVRVSKSIRRIQMDAYGEMGKSYLDIFFTGNGKAICFDKSIQYSEPFKTEDAKEINNVYFKFGNRQTYKLVNGKMVDSDFDFISLLFHVNDTYIE